MVNIGRRGLLRLAGAGALGGLAGCGGGSGSTVDESAYEGKVLTLMAPLPIRPQLNPYAPQTRGMEMLRQFHALVLPVDRATGAYRTSGHTWTLGGEDVSVPCLVEDYAVADDAATYTFDDRFTYWNGDPVTAEAFALRDRARYLINYGGLDADSSFGGELLGEYEYRRALPPDADRATVHEELHPGEPPLPPSFVRPYVERLADATSATAVDEIYRELFGEDVTFTTYMEEGYGTGAYAIEAEEDVTSAAIVGHRREDYPGSASVSHLVVRGVGPDTASSAVGSGSLELGTGHISEAGGDYSRENVPAAIRQLDRHRSARDAAARLIFNWGNSHLRRLAVRRALVAAAPFETALDNTTGLRRAPPAHDSGMLSRADEEALGESFCDALYDYPTKSDTDLAAEWLRGAGYSRETGTWTGPEGNELALTMLTVPQAGAALLPETIGTALSEFGIPVERETVPAQDYTYDIEGGDYDLTFGIVAGGWSPIDQYAGTSGVTRTTFYGPSIAAGNSPLDSCSENPYASVPAEVTLPEDPGALRIEGVEYGEHGSRYVHDAGETVSLCTDAASLTEPDIGDESFRSAARRCARWYNYALPSFVFAQQRVGVWGDTETFSFPDAESRAYRNVGYVLDDPTQYLVQGGLVR